MSNRTHDRTSTLACALALALGVLTPASWAQQTPFSIAGTDAGAGAGPAIVLDDIDGDGAPELLIGSPDAVIGGTAKGRVEVLDGADRSTVVLTLSGSSTGGRFGAVLLRLDDVSGDGIDDFAVAAPGGAGSVTAYNADTGAVLWTRSGSTGDAFGTAMGLSTDRNADGLREVIVGAPGDDDGGTDAGRAFQLDASDGSTLATRDGDDPGDELGVSVSSPHKHDDDSGPVIGASQGGDDGTGYVVVLDALDFSLIERLDGDGSDDRFARADWVGDLTGDGEPDFVVAAVQRDGSGQSTGAGYVKVFDGDDRSLEFQIDGPTGSTAFGAFVAGFGDVDGDGTPDIAVGDPEADLNGTDSGALYVYSGVDGTELQVLAGATGSLFGSHIGALGDVDDDGLDDLLVGAPSDDTGATDAGVVSAVSFSPWEYKSNGVEGTHGVPHISGRGGLLPGTNVTIALSDALENTTAELVIGATLATDPLHQVVSPTPDEIETMAVDGDGDGSFSFAWPSGLPSGTVLYFQVRVPDPAGPHGEALSNTISATAP